MHKTRVLILSAASAVAVLFAVASMPAAAEAVELSADQHFMADEFAIYDSGVDTLAVNPERMLASPGGVSAMMIAETVTTDCQKEVLPGGVAGLSGIGIRGPTLA